MNEVFVMLTGDGKVTTAYNFMADSYEKGKRVAVLKDGDKPNPIVGAIIALCKSMSVKPVDAAMDVLRAYTVLPKQKLDAKAVAAAPAAKEKAKQKKSKVHVVQRPDPANPKKGEQIGLISTVYGRVYLGLDPTIDPGVRHMGRVGTATRFKDCNGKTLRVGDLVIVDRKVGSVRKGQKWESVPGLHFVVDENSADPESNGAFIMGMCGGCNDKTGEIDPNFRVRLAKTWREVELGEEHDMVYTYWKAHTHVEEMPQ